MLTPDKPAAIATAPEPPPQASVLDRIGGAIRARWKDRHAQDWGSTQCGDLANHVLRELLTPPKVALDAAGISEEQWNKFTAAVAEGK